MQPRDEQALAIWQAHRQTTPMSTDARDRMEARLREFFGPTSNEYEAQLDLLRKELSCPEIISPPSSSPSLEAF
jgi:hypothetical protein